MATQERAMTADEAFASAIERLKSGNIGEAEGLLRQVLRQEPGNVNATHMLGVCVSRRGAHADALPLFEAVLRSEPLNPGARNNLGNALHGLGRFAEALACFDALISSNPTNAVFHANRGNALKELGRFEDALTSYDTAISFDADHAGYRYNRGTVLNELRRPTEALAAFERAIALHPGHVSSYINRGNALIELRRFDEALRDFAKAIELDPRNARAHVNRAGALRELKRYDEALASCDNAIALHPELAEAHAARGDVLQELQRYEPALVSYDRAIAAKPDLAPAYANRAHVLRELRQHDAALASSARALAIRPDLPYAFGNWIQLKMACCDWNGLADAFARAGEAIDRGERVCLPFPLLSMPSSPAQQQACARICVGDRYPAAETPLWQGGCYAHDRIRVGYFSADFHNHATAHLIAELLECHDRARFEITAFSFGPSTSDPWRQRIEHAVDRFVDVRQKSDRDIAVQARALEIDVAVDLKGHTQYARTGIFAFRPAPMQVNYLGYPGTLGARYIDYLIADPTVIPPEDWPFYDEKIVTLPHCYQANDATKFIADRPLHRAEHGLPESGFVFCCFNNSFKISPDVFDIWMRLLLAVDGSVLWLLEGNAASVRNLRMEAVRRGVAPNRLVFAARMELAQHLARQRLAGLFLDTSPYNAHTTASDALWAGLPVVTRLGDTFAGRVAASLLTSIGLPELIAQGDVEYEALALRLATQPGALSSVRAKLAVNRGTHPLFDTARFTRSVESAYVAMQARHDAALPADHIVVAEG